MRVRVDARGEIAADCVGVVVLDCEDDGLAGEIEGPVVVEGDAAGVGIDVDVVFVVDVLGEGVLAGGLLEGGVEDGVGAGVGLGEVG